MSVPARRLRWRFALLCAVFVSFVVPAAAHAGTVTFRIDRILDLHCDEGIDESCPNDFYATVFINGQNAGRIPAAGGFTGGSDFTPAWTWTGTVPDNLELVHIQVDMNDHDDNSSDDEVDISPGAGKDLDLDIEQSTGFVAPGAGRRDGEGTGTGNDSAQIFFTVETALQKDFDNDGLSDGVELFGFRNEPGGARTELNALGADPCRKSIALELDWFKTPGHEHKPTGGAITQVKKMFDEAPVNATAGCPFPGYPRKPTGVDLIADLSNAIDYDNAGGANPEPNVNINGSSSATKLEVLRDANFTKGRSPWFHYVLFAHNQPGSTSSGLCCSRDRDLIVTLGSWTNSVGTDREQAGTIVHELGHALGFGHGGVDNVNYKPNYLSAMNYNFQFGLFDGNPATNDAGKLDYSRSALPILTETALDETAGLGGANPPQLSTAWRRTDLNNGSGAEFGALNWNGDKNGAGDPDPTDTNVTVNLNDYDPCVSPGPNKSLDTAAAAGDVASGAVGTLGTAIFQGPDDDCDTAKTGDDTQDLAVGYQSPETADGRKLRGYEDWSRIQYRGFRPGGAGGGSGAAAPHTDITLDQYRELTRLRVAADNENFRLSVGDGSTDEGNTGTKTLSLPVTLDNARDQEIKVDYTIAGGPAPAATVPGDITAPLTGTVTIPANTKTGTIDVKVAGDTVDEAKNEFATVTLSAPQNAVIGDGSGKVTIVDDDRDGVFTCRATGMVIGSARYADTDAPGVKCADATRSVIAKQFFFGVTSVTKNVINGSTEQTPDDLTTAPAVGDHGAANASLSVTNIATGLTMVTISSFEVGARAECLAGGGPPKLTSSSRVFGLVINGKPIIQYNAATTIRLPLGTLKLNQPTVTGNEIVQRAIQIDQLFLPSIVVGEARAGFGGTPVHPDGNPCGA